MSAPPPSNNSNQQVANQNQYNANSSNNLVGGTVGLGGGGGGSGEKSADPLDTILDSSEVDQQVFNQLMNKTSADNASAAKRMKNSNNASNSAVAANSHVISPLAASVPVSQAPPSTKVNAPPAAQNVFASTYLSSLIYAYLHGVQIDVYAYVRMRNCQELLLKASV